LSRETVRHLEVDTCKCDVLPWVVHNDAAVNGTGFFVVGVGSSGLLVSGTRTSGLFNLVTDFRVSSEAVLDGGWLQVDGLRGFAKRPHRPVRVGGSAGHVQSPMRGRRLRREISAKCRFLGAIMHRIRLWYSGFGQSVAGALL
jgi:hypothetical protein